MSPVSQPHTPQPRRRTVLAGSATLAALSLAACGDNGGDAETTGGTSIMLPLFGTATDSESEHHAAIEEFIGDDLTITWVPATDYPDRVTVTMASDSIPKILAILNQDSSFVRSAEAGAFWDLTDKLSDYPNLIAENPEIAQAASVNGRQYGLFRWRDPMRAAALFRADWLEELGMEIPETIDELRTVAEAFVAERPGGQENTGMLLSQWGSTYGGGSPYEFIETWFGAPNGWGERSGKLVPAFDTGEFFEAQRFLRSMREDGLLNADFATLSTVDLDNDFFTGRGGITAITDDAINPYSAKFEEVDPGNGASYIANAGNLIGPSGTRTSYPTPGFNGQLAISRQAVPSEEELGRILEMFDSLNTPEGQNLLTIGVEGENFTMDGEFYVPIEGAEVGENGGASPYQQMVTACNGSTVPQAKPSSTGLEEMIDRRAELRQRDLENAVYNPAAGLISETEINQGAVLNQIIGDARIKFISGEIDEDGYRAEIARWHSSGGDQIITEINELYEKQ